MRFRSLLACLLAVAIPSLSAVADDAASKEDDGKLRIIAFGAHPDDAEFKIGGCAIKWAEQGHHVLIVAVTNGDIGHWQIAGGPLAQRRTAEAAEAAKRMGVSSRVLDIHDGELLPTLENRQTITRLIREWRADLVFTHRPWDYHPDHRNTGLLVQDAAFMVTVPFFCPDTPALATNPVFLYYSDRFKKPYPFTPDVAVATDDVFDRKVHAIDALVTQVYEGGALGSERSLRDNLVADPVGRKALLKTKWAARDGAPANDHRDLLVEWYGADRAKDVKTAEAFEICEYGRQPTKNELLELFPFFGEK
jgi:N-acetylglucosamine malate deacetylase 1